MHDVARNISVSMNKIDLIKSSDEDLKEGYDSMRSFGGGQGGELQPRQRTGRKLSTRNRKFV